MKMTISAQTILKLEIILKDDLKRWMDGSEDGWFGWHLDGGCYTAWNMETTFLCSEGDETFWKRVVQRFL